MNKRKQKSSIKVKNAKLAEEFVLNISNFQKTEYTTSHNSPDKAIFRCHLCKKYLVTSISSRKEFLDKISRGLKQKHYHEKMSILNVDQVNEYLKEANLSTISE